MFSKILKNIIIQSITWHISLLLSLCTSKRDVLNDGWILWPGRPNVMHDSGSTAPPFLQFLPDLHSSLCWTTWVMLHSGFFLLYLAVLPLGFFQDFVCVSSVFQDLLLDLNLILETSVERAERKLALPLWEKVPLPLKHTEIILISVFLFLFLPLCKYKQSKKLKTN